MTYALWIVQGLLALLFLFTGGVKLVLPLEVLTEQFPLPGLFVRFLGVAEVLGAVGLILPGLLGIRPGLTPLAAAGLLIIMMGATVITLAGAVPGGGVAPALIPLVVGLLSAFVAYGRWRLTPHRGVMGAGNADSGQRPSSRGS
jgi:DoxX-like family